MCSAVIQRRQRSLDTGESKAERDELAATRTNQRTMHEALVTNVEFLTMRREFTHSKIHYQSPDETRDHDRSSNLFSLNQ